LDTEGFGTPDLQLIFFPALAASNHADRAWHFTFELETDSTSSEFLWPHTYKILAVHWWITENMMLDFK